MKTTFKAGDRVALTGRLLRYGEIFLNHQPGTVISTLRGIERDGYTQVKFDSGHTRTFFTDRFNLLPKEEPASGKELKAQGQAKARAKAGSEWLATAVARLREYCTDTFSLQSLSEITFDEFRATGRCPEPNNPNAWGSLPRAAVKAGFIVPTSRVKLAGRRKAHARTVKVWGINTEAL